MTMPFQPVILITDALFFLLTAAIIAFVFMLRSRPHLKRPWQKVVQRKTGAVSLLVLLCYYSIALLDSMHFHPRLVNGMEYQDSSQVQSDYQYSNEILSVLDVIMTPMRIQVEKTFSAPLATQSLSKEMIQNDDGSIDRIYPRLEFGGAHLDNPATDKMNDIQSLVVQGLMKGLLIWMGICLLCLLVLGGLSSSGIAGYYCYVRSGRSEYPVATVALCLAVIIVLINISMTIGTYYHLFGTDKVGQDVFYQAIKSIRTGVLIGALTTLVMLPVAIILGSMAGFFRGWIDDLIQYVYTTLNSIPNVLLIAASVLLIQVYMNNHADSFDSLTERADMRLLFLCLILGITSWTGLCRLLRAETFKLREMEYIQAATAFGVSQFKILSRHIMPNFMHIVLITVVLDFSGLVLAEAVLSYINIGVDPATNSWGNMINQARLEMAREPVVWWSLTAAFIFMFILVLFANLFADVVRDALDPRISGGDA